MNQDKSVQAQPLGPGTPDEEFEQLRQRFYERLRKEQTQLAALIEVLGSSNVAPASTLVDIAAFAHRLRGAALVFGFQGLGDGAKAVELAAIAASPEAIGPRCDPSVISTMRTLASSLADEVGTGASYAPAMTYSTESASKASSW